MDRLLERFLRYVKVDTESCPDLEQVPSTEKQKDLSRMLAKELREMGASDVVMDEEHCYVYAVVPGNTNSNYKLGFIAHVDTSSAVSGKDVKPIVTENYDGKDIPLAEGRVLSMADFSSLSRHIGKTIVSSDGTTLLGADDKAGVAVIMELSEHLLTHPEIKHGTIKIAFTPDEEVGHGVSYFNLKQFDADGAYTIDGGTAGELECENFNAAGAKVTVHGVSVHPGSAKNLMKNACLILMELQSMLPVEQNPAYTEGYEGFFHLDEMHGSVDFAEGDYIIRDFDMTKFLAKKKLMEDAVSYLNSKYGKGTVELSMHDSYYNMKEKLVPHKHLIDNAMLAIERTGLKAVMCPIRGGTDGAMLCYKGLPCPNLFTGGYNFHGRYEYLCYEEMQKSFETALNLVDIYKDR